LSVSGKNIDLVRAAFVLLPLSLSAESQAQAPRVLEWGSFADEGPAAAKPVVVTKSVATKPAPAPHEKQWKDIGPPVVTSMPDAKPKDTPAASGTSASTAGPDGGWRDFLERTVAKALAISPDVREATSRWQASQFDIDEARGQRWPQVQVGAATPSATFGPGTNDSARYAIGNVQVTTPVYDWGRISRTVESRTETANAAQEQMLQVRQQVAYDTVNGLVELRRNQQALAISDAYVARMTELVDMLAEIVKVDRGRDSELVQARGRRLQALASRDLVVARLREVQISLAKLVGEEVRLPAQLSWNAPVLDVQEALAAAPDHPSLRQARAEAKAADLYAQSVHASRLPQLNWVVSKTTQQDAYGNVQPWATGLSVQWTAFQGGSGQAAERAAFGRAQASQDKAMAATRDLEYRLRTSAQQRDAALGRAQEYTPLIQDSDRVRKIFFEQWYHLGRRTLLDVLIAEAELYNNQIAQVNSRYDAEAADLRMRADAAVLLPWVFGGRKVTR
jgi:adhesin transport system outer membrane protein